METCFVSNLFLVLPVFLVLQKKEHILPLLVLQILLLLLALKTEGSPESALMFGFIAYLFVYALYLFRVLEQPFMKEHGSFDDVSLFLLTELSEKFTAARSPVAEGRRLR